MNDVSKIKQNFINSINKIIMNHKVSHSYLIEVNDYDNDMVYIYHFIKMILCNIPYEEISSSDNPIISLIDHDNYPDIKIIEPDGAFIKKNQLLDLQKEYSNKSLLDGKRIYIIKNAERLNSSSANTMLKFLEEPEEDIIAILVTDNRYHVIETILSRCQTLTLKEDYYQFTCEDSILDFLKCIIHPNVFFLRYNYYINQVIVDKDIAKKYFSEIQNILISYLNYKNGIIQGFDKNIDSILDSSSDKKLLYSLSIIEEELSKLEYNVNYKLWLDSLFSKLVIGG